jgi:hypothetical protein
MTVDAYKNGYDDGVIEGRMQAEKRIMELLEANSRYHNRNVDLRNALLPLAKFHYVMEQVKFAGVGDTLYTVHGHKDCFAELKRSACKTAYDLLNCPAFTEVPRTNKS